MGCGAKTRALVLEDQKGCTREGEKFKYFGVKIDKEDRQGNDIRIELIKVEQ